MKKDFNKWLNTFRESISDYKYYVSFDNVYNNTNKYRYELNLLNSLIGVSDIENEFKKLINTYPLVLNAIPILLSKRESEIYCRDFNGGISYRFDIKNCSDEQYCYFMRETGLFDLISKHLISNIYDYVTGVNVGLDSNGRKNRGGHLMEDFIEDYLKKGNFEYYKEMTSSEVERKFNIDLSLLVNNGDVSKRFDYVVKGTNTIYGIECNFYTGGGSKLNETARSYKLLFEESKHIENFKFVWFTDGKGWESCKRGLKETFDIANDMYNLFEIENGVMFDIFK